MSLLSWLYQRTNRRPHTQRTPARKPAAGFRPRFEALEGRDLPSFAAPVAYPVPPKPLAVVATDVNGDGRADLVTLAGNGNFVLVQLNDTKGGFGAAQRFFVRGTGSASAMAVGDVNGDGKPDVVLANTNYASGGSVSGTYTGGVSVLLGNGMGGFTYGPTSAIFQGTPAISSIALAHLNDSPGEMDLVAVPRTGMSVLVARPVGTNGSFGHAQSFPIAFNAVSAGSCELTVGDVNLDGRPDVVVTEPYQNRIAVLLRNGSSTLGLGQYFAVGGTPTAVAVGDVSGDGLPDVVTTNTNGTVSVLLAQGGGVFGVAQSYAVGGPANSVALADFNRDGRLDVATAGGTETDVLLNNGNDTFKAYQKVGPAGASVVAADFNTDGYPDLAEVVAASSSIDALLNQANW